MSTFLVLLDTPSIGQYVFATDHLAEIRGASALLDRLNREETENQLRRKFGNGCVKVYAAGGAGQFLITAASRHDLESALEELSAFYARETAGEIQVVWGIGELLSPAATDYHRALSEAFSELTWKRLCQRQHFIVPTFPLAVECQSTSYLPATEVFHWAGEIRVISEASRRKYEEASKVARGHLWQRFVAELVELPEELRQDPDALRCRTIEEIGKFAEVRRGYVGLVYADGNAMGRLVQELDSPETATAFSRLVDESIRDACHQSLAEIFQDTIQEISRLPAASEHRRIPADILLLGGDDLVVVLPADRALPFAIRVSQLFERATQEAQEKLPPVARQFFGKRLAGRGLTLSLGVAIGPARYPFYLLLELADQLLASAKRGGSSDPDAQPYWAPSYIDFHIQTGSATQDLEVVRTEDYRIKSSHVRTLRPYRREKLETLWQAARDLAKCRLPQSKRHDLLEAALEPRPRLAEWRAKELFGRLSETRFQPQRSALYTAMCLLGPVDLNDFPWTHTHNGKPRKATVLADLMEVYDFVRQTGEGDQNE
jgi:GGDEF domain-containing protein